MPQVLIYGHREFLYAEGCREKISEAIHGSVVQVLRIPPEKRFHRFIPMEPGDFLHPDDRGIHYLVIEILLFKGRSRETLKQLIRSLFSSLEASASVPPHSVEMVIRQIPPERWGIRGQPGDELKLTYRIEQSRDLS